ncbi:MAG TPA: hypothetical protein VMW58_11670 [Anaerolineae bacterium]|nr:hypothetical protein [Anaerolineae bacterium]
MTTYSVGLTTAILDGSSTVRTDTTTGTGTIAESFWAEVSVPAGASDTVLKLNLLTDPDVLIILGAEGISFKLDSTGTDAISADPIAVISNDADGLGIDEILLSNSDSAPHTITIVAFET